MVVDGGPPLTYGAWDRRSNAVARGLASRGVRAGDRVVLAFDHAAWTDYGLAYAGVHKVGAVAVPTTPRLSRIQAARLAHHNQASAIVAAPGRFPTDTGIWTAEVDALEQGQSDDAVLPPAASELAEVLCPPGMMGLPPGRPRRHDELVRGALAQAVAGPSRSAVRFLHTFAVGTEAGQQALRLPLEVAEAVTMTTAGFDPDRFCALIPEHGVEVVGLSPSMARTILDSGATRGRELGSVTRLLVAPSPASPPLLARLADTFPAAEVVGVELGVGGVGTEDASPPTGGAIRAGAGSRGDVEETIAAMWQRVLGVEHVGRDDDFFGRGGHPLAASKVLALIHDAFGVELAFASFLRSPTVAGLAAAVEQAGAGRASAPKAAGVAPVAFSQEGMLWHEQLAPGSLNLPPLVRRYRGQLDVGSLERALIEITRRHQALRSTFEVRHGRPVQVVVEPLARLPVLDVSGLPSPQQDQEVAAVISEAATRAFDLVRDRLFEPRLVRLAPDDHVLVIRLHHIVYDDWCGDLFRQELSALYTAFVAGQPSPLPEPPLHFGDFCREQRRVLAGQAGTTQLAYWRRVLAGAPLITQLPIHDPELPPGSPHPASEPLAVVIPAEVAEQLRALARHQRVTPFMAMLAAFAVLVHRDTAQDDLVIASVVANRNRTELEGLIASFSKKIPLRVQLGGDPSFVELLGRVRDVVLGAWSHQDLSFETLIQEALGADAAAHGLVPHVGVMFQAQAPQTARLNLPGLEVSRYEVPATTRTQMHFAAGGGVEAAPSGWGGGLYFGTFLNLTLETGEELRCVARGAFHPPRVEQLLDELRGLGADLVSDPERRISQVPGARRPSTGPSDQVDLRGFGVEPARMEAAMASCPGVRDVAVALSPEASQPPRLVACVVAEDGHPPTLEQLRHAVWDSLPGYAWPAAMVVVGGDGRPLPPPTSPTGSASEAPRRPEDHLLTTLWAEAIGADQVSVDQNYWQDFSFLEVVDKAYQAGLRLGARNLARARTVAMLVAAEVAARPSQVAARPEPREGGDRLEDDTETTAVARLADQGGADLSRAVASGPKEGEPAPAPPGPSPVEVIRTQGLTKHYSGGVVAVDGLDVSVFEGEIFGLLGPNGAGKTTTVGMLTTLAVPTAGRALVGGIDVVAEPARAKQAIGVMPQTNTLDRSLTVWENLYFHGLYFGMRPKAARAAADEVLERLRLAARAKARVDTLSGGMAQRLMLARAILHRPAVLFLDEPTAGLDPQSRIALWDIMSQLHAEGQTILLTTHYMEEADRFCDRVAIMDRGRILALDSPARLKREFGAGAAITLKAEGDLELLAQRLASVAGTSDANHVDGAVHLQVDEAEGVLPRVIAIVEEEGFKLSELSLREPTLETVFITLTGKELRE